MSRAEPMATRLRLAYYRRTNGKLTVAQERRIRKQDNKRVAFRRNKKRAADRARRAAARMEDA